MLSELIHPAATRQTFQEVNEKELCSGTAPGMPLVVPGVGPMCLGLGQVTLLFRPCTEAAGGILDLGGNFEHHPEDVR